MSFLRRRLHRDERGASLVLAIAFMVIAGSIGAAVVTSVASGLNGRGVLNQVRNREYAADGGVENAIAQVRYNMTNGKALPPTGPGTGPCAGLPVSTTLNAVQVQVDCSYVPTLATGYLQRNVLFSAHCASVHLPACPTTNVIIRAQVNFASASLLSDPSIAVTSTYIQSWSVNG